MDNAEHRVAILDVIDDDPQGAYVGLSENSTPFLRILFQML